MSNYEASGKCIVKLAVWFFKNTVIVLFCTDKAYNLKLSI